MTGTGTLCYIQGERQCRQDLSQRNGMAGGRVERSVGRGLGHNATASLLHLDGAGIIDP